MAALRTRGTLSGHPNAGAWLLQAGACASWVFVVACSSASHHPPELGNCVPEDDASCADPAAGGAGVELPIDAGTPSIVDTGILVAVDEAGSCGIADTLIATPCAPCIVASCCMADSICSADDACLSALSCAVNGGSCPPLTIPSTIAFDDLQTCFELNCPTQCQAIAPHDF